jgi:parvulin-like peptidyl-prolyl isomerase
MTVTVNGETIEDVQIQQEIERLRPRYEQTFADRDPAEREAQLIEWSKENVIERVLLLQEARTKGPVVSEVEVEAVLANLRKKYESPEAVREEFGLDDEKLMEMIELQIRLDRTIERICKTARQPTDEEISDYYEQHKWEFASSEQVHVAQIVKRIDWQTDEENARQIITEMHERISGGVAFEIIARSTPDSGDLGYVSRGQTVEEFEHVVFGLGDGQVSGVFRTRFGYHIAKVYDRRPPAVPEPRQVKKQIVEKLTEEMREQKLSEHLDALRSQAAIEED